jgi:FtsP/CotA-like multicopper oxidase with cupredoxin domain
LALTEEIMATRRRFLKTGATVGAGAYLASRFGFWKSVLGQVPGGTLPPGAIPKFVSPLTIPPAMPRRAGDATADYYSIAVRQFAQQILPPSFRPTSVWGYGSITDARTFSYPAATIEATAARPTRVTWMNQLVDANGHYLSHLLPVDQTLHWANPPGGLAGRDMRGLDPSPYTGPVPLVTHLHGHHSTEESDGYPEAWYLPAARNLPAGFASVGTWYEYFHARSKATWNVDWQPGSSTFTYENDQRATTLWYHDHALGLTRVNVYAGPAGFYLIRGGSSDLAPGVLPGPAPSAGDAPSMDYYEIPILIQDRSFDANCSLFYPDNRAFFEGLAIGQLQIPFIPQTGCSGLSDVSRIWNPEFFGNTMVVNGRTWPHLVVEQRRYRFRFLNGCDSRFLILTLSRDTLPFWQIGSDGGFLPAPVELRRLLLAPAERADVIVDFTGVPVGTEILLLNVGPDEPFGGGLPDVDFDRADPGTTGQVLQFRVVAGHSRDVSTPPSALSLPAVTRLEAAQLTRPVSINEAESTTVFVDGHPGHGHRRHQPPVLKLACGDPDAVPFGPTHAMLGTLTADGRGNPLPWTDPVTENPSPGAIEVWEIHNTTEDAHPIHIHLVQFEIVERVDASGQTRGPESWETGTKDTVIAYPAEITRVKARFDQPGRFAWHCHILEHEDNEMMRPYVIGPITGPADT